MFVKIKSDKFHSVTIDLYKNDNDEIFLTREQIGKALGYFFPNKTIKKIHDRYFDRLQKDSEIAYVNGIDTYLYSVNAVLKICCWSTVNIADEFMKWVLNNVIKKNNYIENELAITSICDNRKYTMKQVVDILFSGVGRNKLFKFLREQKILNSNNIPYKKFIETGYFITKTKIVDVTVKKIEIHQTFVSESGIDFIKNLCLKYGFNV